MAEQGNLEEPEINVATDVAPFIGVLPMGWMPGYAMDFGVAQQKNIQADQMYQEKQDKKDKDKPPKPPRRPNARIGRLVLEL